MKKRSSHAHCLSLVAVVCTLVCSFGGLSFGQGATGGSKGSAAGSQHTDVSVSDQSSTEDRVSAKLTPGERKALATANTLGPDSAAIFNSDGTLVRKGPTKELDSSFKACKDLRPISDRCWLCKDNGTIFCVASKGRKPDSSGSHMKPDSK
jgi:hypothetical protein